MKPVLPDAVAVNVAQVPPTYHVPPLMMQPLLAPPSVTSRYPLPENGVPGAVVPVGAVVVVVVVGAGEPVLGKYLIPVDGQSELDPTDTSISMYSKYINYLAYLGLWE